MPLYKEQGIVLRAHKLGEADKIVSVLTQGSGKVRAVAKGIRKTTSKFGARLEPTSRVAVQCYKGRELDIVTQAETLDAHRALREDYALLTRAIPMLEAVDQVGQEREPNPSLYRMLTGALHTLVVTRNPLVTPAFFWKLLSLEGFHPVLDECARCGEAPDPADAPGSASAGTRERELVAFDLGEGGMVCRSCARGGGRPVTPGGLALLRRVLGGGLNAALAEAPGPAAQEVEQLGIRALEHHVERRMRSTVLL